MDSTKAAHSISSMAARGDANSGVEQVATRDRDVGRGASGLHGDCKTPAGPVAYDTIVHRAQRISLDHSLLELKEEPKVRGIAEAVAATQSCVVAVMCELVTATRKRRSLCVWDIRAPAPAPPGGGGGGPHRSAGPVTRDVTVSSLAESRAPQIVYELSSSKYTSLDVCELSYNSEGDVCVHVLLASPALPSEMELITLDLRHRVVLRHSRSSSCAPDETVRGVRIAQVCPQLLYGCMAASREGPSTVCARDALLGTVATIQCNRGGEIVDMCFVKSPKENRKDNFIIDEMIIICCEKGLLAGWAIRGVADEATDGMRVFPARCSDDDRRKLPTPFAICLFEYSISPCSPLRSVCAYGMACAALNENILGKPDAFIVVGNEDSVIWTLLARHPRSADEGSEFSCNQLRRLDLGGKVRGAPAITPTGGNGGGSEDTGGARSNSALGPTLSLCLERNSDGELYLIALFRSYLILIDSKRYGCVVVFPFAKDGISFVSHGSFAALPTNLQTDSLMHVTGVVSKLFDTESSPILVRVALPSHRSVEAASGADDDIHQSEADGQAPVYDNQINVASHHSMSIDQSVSGTLSFFSSALAREAVAAKAGLNNYGDNSAEQDMDPLVHLPDASPLRFQYSPPKTPEMHVGAMRSQSKGRASGVSWEQGGRVDKATGKLLSLPVTFHDRIKSSGYGHQAKAKPLRASSAPRRVAEQGSRKNVSAPRHVGSVVHRYPVDSGPPLIAMSKNDYPGLGSSRRDLGPLHGLSISEDGRWAGLVSENAILDTIRIPVHKYPDGGMCYMGHNGRLTSVHFSHDNSMVLSASEDGTARLWRLGRVESPAVIFSHRRSHPRLGAPGKLGLYNGMAATADDSFGANVRVGAMGRAAASVRQERNKPFGAPISTASFFHMDQFVMIASKASVFMYAYDTEGTDASNDIKRLQSFGKYRLVTEFDHADALRVSAFSCINSVQSVLCVSATTDRNLQFLDTAVGSIVRRVDCAHEKPVHCIALPQPSIHAAVAPETLNLLATAAIDNAITLWDIRVPTSIGRYAGHVNRRESVQCAFSPCMRYLATGSEDRSARIVDLRAMRELGRVGQGAFRDVVTGVAFHPMSPQLAACSFDGKIRFFGSSGCAPMI